MEVEVQLLEGIVVLALGALVTFGLVLVTLMVYFHQKKSEEDFGDFFLGFSIFPFFGFFNFLFFHFSFSLSLSLSEFSL